MVTEPDDEEPAPSSAERGRNPDPHKSTFITIVGKKESGKTEVGYLLFESYPFDRVVIDPNGDIKVPEDTLELESPIPARWPVDRFEDTRERAGGRRRKQQTLRFVPNFAEPDYLEQMDRVIAMAYGHGKTMVFADEAHELFPAGKTPPHARRALRQGRHRDLSLILAMPRAKTVDPLTVSQADWVYVFNLPNPDDRKRVAENIGWDPATFDEAVHDLGQYEYLRFDSARDDLAHFPPLPSSVIRHHKGVR